MLLWCDVLRFLRVLCKWCCTKCIFVTQGKYCFSDQIPKRGLLYIRGIPKHITEEKLANSLKAIEAIIPNNLMDKRIGWVFPVQTSKSCLKSIDLEMSEMVSSQHSQGKWSSNRNQQSLKNQRDGVGLFQKE